MTRYTSDGVEIRTEKEHLMVVAGIDGSFPPNDIQVEVAQRLEWDLESNIIHRDEDINVSFLKHLRPDERELLSPASQYAIRLDIVTKDRITDSDSLDMEIQLKESLKGSGFNVEGTESKIFR